MESARYEGLTPQEKLKCLTTPTRKQTSSNEAHYTFVIPRSMSAVNNLRPTIHKCKWRWNPWLARRNLPAAVGSSWAKAIICWPRKKVFVVTREACSTWSEDPATRGGNKRLFWQIAGVAAVALQKPHPSLVVGSRHAVIKLCTKLYKYIRTSRYVFCISLFDCTSMVREKSIRPAEKFDSERQLPSSRNYKVDWWPGSSLEIARSTQHRYFSPLSCW